MYVLYASDTYKLHTDLWLAKRQGQSEKERKRERDRERETEHNRETETEKERKPGKETEKKADTAVTHIAPYTLSDLSRYNDDEGNIEILSSNHGDGEDDEDDGSPTYTVEEAVEKIGIGWFQFRLWGITGLFSVCRM